MTRTGADLAEWLEKHGLGQYTALFAQNDIDESVLPDLTEADLEKLGLSLGHRKKLLKAVAALENKTAAPAEAPAITASPAVIQHREPELRHITVVFCDLVGSTQLAEKLDPEDLQNVTEAYRRVCSTAIARYGGEVVRYFGDGVMAFFGWPRAHEDDAHRAVHASLQIVAEVSAISGAAILSCRIGVCSGPVVIAEGGDGLAPLVDAVGETPNIAARLQSLAAIDTVVIAESTRKLVSAAFDLQDLGLHALKGVSNPVEVYRVLAAKTAVSRFEAARSGFLRPLIGRKTELNVLLDRWEKVKAGDGQVVLLSGVAGVGKSRLLHELRSQIAEEPHHALHHQCSPHHTNSAFFPVIEQIEQSAQLKTDDTDAQKLAKLATYLPAPVGSTIEAQLLLANLLSLSVESRPELSELTSQQIKNKTIGTLVDILIAFSSQQPTICIFEDAHWLDPSTLELLELMINRTSGARVLLIISCRPEFRPTWAGHPNVTSHSLTRLSQNEVRVMIRGLAQGGSVPDQLLDQIAEKADGVPLFVEELTSSTLAAPSRAPTAADGPNATPPLRVPDSLSDAFMERLDRVAPERRIAQLAAVIGREFSCDLLTAAARVDPNEIQAALTQLEEADIVYRLGVSPSVRFAFKHVLLRDAIYDSLLRSKRQQSHADIAEVLERDFAEIVEAQPELLAYHHQEAGNGQAAVRYWMHAGERASARSAHVEAIASFRSALQVLSTLPETQERNEQEISIQLALGIPVIAVEGYGSPETREVFSRARALCLKLGDVPQYVQCLFGLWGHAWMGGRNDDARRMAEEFLVRARVSHDPALPIVAHRVMGSTLLTAGDFRSSADHLEKSIALSQSDGKHVLHSRFMVEPRAASLLLLSWDLWFLGYPDQALARVSEATALAQDLRHPYTIAFSHYMSSVVHLFRGEPDFAFDTAQKSFAMSQEQRFSLYSILSRISRGRAAGELGRIEEGRREIDLGLEEARRSGVGYMLPMMNSWLADLHVKAGELDRGLALVEDLLSKTDDASGRAWEAELYRQKAEILLALDPPKLAEAEACLARAVEIARAQAAKSLELRAIIVLAQLWQKQDRHADAEMSLKAVRDWFKEGHKTADIRRAHVDRPPLR